MSRNSFGSPAASLLLPPSITSEELEETDAGTTHFELRGVHVLRVAVVHPRETALEQLDEHVEPATSSSSLFSLSPHLEVVGPGEFLAGVGVAWHVAETAHVLPRLLAGLQEEAASITVLVTVAEVEDDHLLPLSLLLLETFRLSALLT